MDFLSRLRGATDTAPGSPRSRVIGEAGKERVVCGACGRVYNLATICWENTCECLQAERASEGPPEGQ